MVAPTPHSGWRERLNISRMAIQHRWLTLGFWIAVMVAGLLAFSSLKYALFPDITFPVVVVSAEASLTTALDTESQLTVPIEQELQSLKSQGLQKIQSSTFPGRSIVSLSFEVGTELAESSDRVTARLKQLKLPGGATYTITPINLNEASVISYALTSQTRSLSQLADLAESKIVPTLSHLPGVLKVKLIGIPLDVTTTSPQLPKEQVAVLPAGTSAVRFAGQNAVAVEVVKRSDANTLEVISQVEKAVQQLRSALPDVTLNLAVTQAAYIREATQSTLDALELAIALSVIVIFPFLWNWKATLISALAIPTSLLGTFIVMAIFGFNLDTITLLALALVIGIIVDDAIVDVENISRHLEAGEPPKQAAIAATNEIGLTVTAATFAIVAVFLPVGLMQNVLGQFFRPFGVTVSAAVIISLLVARTLSPLLAVQWLRTQKSDASDRGWLWFAQGYQNILQWALKHRWIVIGIALMSFVVGIAMIPQLPKGFIPKLNTGEFYINFTASLPFAPTETQTKQPPLINPLSNSVAVAEKLEKAVFQLPDLESVYTTIGARSGDPTQGRLFVKFKNSRTLSTAQLEDQTRQLLPAIAGVTTSIQDVQFVDTGGEKPLQVALLGNDPVLLSQTAKTIQQRLQKTPGFVDVATTGEAIANGKLNEIERLNQQRVAYISANVQAGLGLGNATDRVIAIANQVKPANVTLSLGGDSARQDEIFSSFGITLALSVLCILGVLAMLFKSWTDPFVIILALPLSVLGALVASLLTREEFSIISVIGIFLLLGLTNKNAILIVDYINQLRRTGLSCNEAILKAVPIRLRPILMTTLATILGMMPIALGLGTGAELRAPMAIAIIGGLFTSTLLSLLVIPVIYALLNDLHPKNWRTKKPQHS